MTSTPVQPGTRPRSRPATRFRLDIAEWLTLRAALQAPVHVDVVGRFGRTGVHQSTAWSRSRGLTLTRRWPAAGEDAGPEQEPAVELAIGGQDGLFQEIWRALPGHDVPGSGGARTPVRVGWQGSAAVARAVHRGHEDLAAHLAKLPAEALALLGSVSTTLLGSAHVAIGHDGARPRVHGVWLWTETDVVELLDASAQAVVLRRTTTERLRSELLNTLTGLHHAPPGPAGRGPGGSGRLG